MNKKIAEVDKLFKNELVKKNIPLKKLNSFRVGGSSEFFFEPTNENELLEVLKLFIKNNISISIIGDGTNLLISDKGILGLVISLKKMNSIEILTKKNNSSSDVFVKVGAGLLTNDFTKWGIENSVSGLENFGGLPGTVGGACFMNARCYGYEISDIIYSSENFILTYDNKIEFSDYHFNKNDWGYKVSPFQKNAKGIKILQNRQIIMSVIFKLSKGNFDEIKKRTEECYIDRVNKGHYKAASAGSTFKNNRSFGKSTGQIIEELGLKGLSIGGAEVSTWHGNFIINKYNASSKDIAELIYLVQKKVYEKTNFLLEPEVIFCGEGLDK